MKALLIIAPHFSAEQLQQAYLTAISWLNFEHDLSVLWLEGSGHLIERHQVAKQWQSLWLYGLQNSFHIGNDEMAVRSQKISSKAVEKLLQLVDCLL